MELWLFFLAGIGLDFIVTRSYILEPVRDWSIRFPKLNYLINCLMCSGLWCGMIAAIPTFNIVGIICNGFAVSGIAYILGEIIDRQG